MIKYHVSKQEPNMTAYLLRARCARLGIKDVEGIQTIYGSWSCIVHSESDAEKLDNALPRKIAIDEQLLHKILVFADVSIDDEWVDVIKQLDKAIA